MFAICCDTDVSLANCYFGCNFVGVGRGGSLGIGGARYKEPSFECVAGMGPRPAYGCPLRPTCYPLRMPTMGAGIQTNNLINNDEMWTRRYCDYCVKPLMTGYLKNGGKLLITKSGRRGSNPRRPAWEIGR